MFSINIRALNFTISISSHHRVDLTARGSFQERMSWRRMVLKEIRDESETDGRSDRGVGVSQAAAVTDGAGSARAEDVLGRG